MAAGSLSSFFFCFFLGGGELARLAVELKKTWYAGGCDRVARSAVVEHSRGWHGCSAFGLGRGAAGAATLVVLRGGMNAIRRDALWSGNETGVRRAWNRDHQILLSILSASLRSQVRKRARGDHTSTSSIPPIRALLCSSASCHLVYAEPVDINTYSHFIRASYTFPKLAPACAKCCPLRRLGTRSPAAGQASVFAASVGAVSVPFIPCKERDQFLLCRRVVPSYGSARRPSSDKEGRVDALVSNTVDDLDMARP